MGKEWKDSINLKTNSRYDENGIDRHGFNKNGINIITGTQFDENGFNRFGFDEEGFNKYGININGRFVHGYSVRYYRRIYGSLEEIIDIIASDKNLYSQYVGEFPILKLKQEQRVFNKDGIDTYGFNKDGICIITNQPIDRNGYNALGYNADGYDREGYNFYGYDINGYDEYGYNLNGRDKFGYDREGYDKNGFNIDGINKETKIEYDKNGYNKDGYNKDGYNKDGYDKDGYDKNGYNKDGYDKNGFNKDGLNKKGKSAQEVKETKDKQRNNFLGLLDVAEKLGTGAISMDQYMMRTKMSIDELIEFAKKQNMSAKVIRGLYGKKKDYAQYSKKFNPKEYLEHTTLFINEQEIKPTKEDVDKCIEYLKENGRYICDKTVRETIRDYKKGIIIIKEDEKNKTINHIKELQKQEKELDAQITIEKEKNTQEKI